MSDCLDKYDDDPPNGDEGWEDDMPDHWFANYDGEEVDEQYEAAKPEGER